MVGFFKTRVFSVLGHIFFWFLIVLFSGRIVTLSFAEHRLIDVGIFYGKYSPAWTEITTDTYFTLRIDKQPAGNIGATSAIGFDGLASVFYPIDENGMSVTGLILKPASGYAIVLERFYNPLPTDIALRKEYYEKLGLSVLVGYDGSIFLGIGGFESDEKAMTYVKDKDIKGEIISTWGYYQANSIQTGSTLLLLSAYNRDSSIHSDLIRMYCSSSKGAKRYRGAFRCSAAKDSRLALVNRVDLEDYLYGVVPVEISGSSPMEALKAQAVAARNYAVYPTGKYAKYGFDVDDTTGSQAYMGYDSEYPDSNQAVDATRGEYLMYGNEVVVTYFSASSGGYMDSVHDVWGGNNLPYFYAKPDPYSQNYTWSRDLDASLMTGILNRVGANIGNPIGLEISERSVGGRAKTVTILGDRGSKTLNGDLFKGLTGTLKSTLITFDSNYAQSPYDPRAFTGEQEPEGHSYIVDNSAKGDQDKTGSSDSKEGEYLMFSAIHRPIVSERPPFIVYSEKNEQNSTGEGQALELNDKWLRQYVVGFPGTERQYFQGKAIRVYGHGWGHGIGMSQLGAVEMAKQGKNYREILSFYYNSQDFFENR